jgi:hypothetical protein
MKIEETEENSLRNDIHPKRWAFLAGLIDGDGSFSIRHDKRAGYQLTVNVYSTSRNLMNWLVEVFDGQYRKMPTKGNRKQKYAWYSGNKDIPMNVAPHLLLKKSQAESSVLFFNLGAERNPQAREDIMRDIQNANDFYVPANKQDVQNSRKNPIEPTKLDWAYLAGLFDAEGTFGLHKRRKKGNGSYTSYAKISNTDNRVFLWIVPRFGGGFSVMERKDDKDEGAWTLSGSPSLAGRKEREIKLLSLVPYLVAKQERAVLFMEWIRNNHSLTKEQKLEYFLKMKALNKRGISQETNTANCPLPGQMIESDPVGDYGREPAVMLSS